MNKFTTTLFLAVFLSHLTFSQAPSNYIISPDWINTNIVPQDTVSAAFNRVDSFLEYIYRPSKVSILYPPNHIPQYQFDPNNVRWPQGCWGRGRFSKDVDRKIFFKQPINYNFFWNKYDTIHYRSPNYFFWTTHPENSYCARIIAAYIHRYYFESDQTIPNQSRKSRYLERIIDGLNYLMNQQSKDGGYIQWLRRPGQNIPNTNDNIITPDFENAYDTGESIRTFVESYYFIKKITPIPTLQRDILNAIRKAANFLNITSPGNLPVNYRAFTVWGLASAFRLTADSIYLNRAISIYIDEIDSCQNDDGSWHYGSYYHDTAPWYVGIIIRGLAELFSVIPSSYDAKIKSQIRNSIYKSINHFLITGMTKDGGRRLQGGNRTPPAANNLPYDGQIIRYKYETDYDAPGKTPQLAIILISGLYQVLHTNGFFLTKSDSINTNSFLNAITRPLVEYDKWASPALDQNTDDNILSYALYSDINPWRNFEPIPRIFRDK